MLRQFEKRTSGHCHKALASPYVGEYSFCIKDPVGNWVEIYQRAEQYHPKGLDDGGGYFTDEYTAILFAEDLEKITAFYRDSMQMPVVASWDRGPEDQGCRLRSAGGFTDIRQKTGTHRRALR